MASVDFRGLIHILVVMILFSGILMQGNGYYMAESSRFAREAPSNSLSMYQGPEEHRPGCGHPDTNDNSRAMFYGDWAPTGSVINYTCDPGFHNLGSESRVCLPDGTWSGEPLLCARKISTGKSMECMSCSSASGPQMAYSTVDDTEQTCENVPTNAQSQWKLDLFTDYQAIRQFRLVFHGKGTEIPVVRIFIESTPAATRELHPSECQAFQNQLRLDYHELIIRPKQGVRSRYVNFQLNSRNANSYGLCEAEVFSEAVPSVHQCFDLNLLDGSVQARSNLKRTFINEGRCYTLDDMKKVPWKTANENCEKVNHGSLAHDLSPSANNVLVNFLKVTNIAGNYWIGGHAVSKPAPGYSGKNVVWQWITGNAISKDLWMPKDVQENQCLAIIAPSGVWLNFVCHAATGSICESFIQRCGSPKRNLRVLITGALVTEVGAVITHTCPSGFQLTGGDKIRRCLPSGQWSGSSPSCYSDGEYQRQLRDQQLPAEAIAGIIAGIIVGLILIAGVLIMILCRRKASFKKTIHFNKNGKHGESVETLDKEAKGKDKERLKSETKENYQAVNPDDCETK